jgi:RNA polymerase sigma-54 factor
MNPPLVASRPTSMPIRHKVFIELKYFFNSSIKRVHGEDIASASVQAKIKKSSSKWKTQKSHYSDSKMADLLKTDNINIARRTVAKYREMMGILSSSKRKQY